MLLEQLCDRPHLDACLARDDTLHAGRIARLATFLRDDHEACLRGRNLPAAAFAVPGRIELIGKHVDYAGGRSLTCAVNRGFCVVAVPRDDRLLVIHDVGRGQETLIPIAADHTPRRKDWSRYPHALATRLARDLPAVASRAGVTIAFESDLPVAAGISSSSALVVSIWLPLAWAASRAGAALPAALDQPETLAGYLGAAESGRPFPRLTKPAQRHADRGVGPLGVGPLGGAQDHVAILCAQAGKLLQARYAPERIERWITPAASALPSGSPSWTWIVQPSGIVAHKAGGARDAYNRLAHEARALAARWQGVSGQHIHTPGAAIDAGASPRALRRACRDEPGLNRRLEQFLFEEASVIAAADALAAGDLSTFGELVGRSQALAESHLGNQIPETSFLVQTAIDLGAHAASAFGAGFGGAVWAMVERDRTNEFRTAWSARYTRRFPHAFPQGAAAARATSFITDAGSPACRLV
jgi:galactokinase